jgi:hypothetical protein
MDKETDKDMDMHANTDKDKDTGIERTWNGITLAM